MEGQALGGWQHPRVPPASLGIRDSPLPSDLGGGMDWDGNEAPKLQGNSWSPNPRCLQDPVLFSWCWDGNGHGRGHFAVSPGESPEVPQLPGHLNPRGRRGQDTSVGSAGCTGVTGVALGMGAEPSALCCLPKVLSQCLAPEGEPPEPPGCADKGKGPGSALGVPPSSCPQQDPWGG